MFNKKRNVRGQVTVFIIIAILVVAAGILLYYFYPKFKTTVSPESTSPSGFVQDCISEKIEETVEMISLQGGSVEPDFSFNYQGNEIEYLCYTNEYYKTCVVQQPMLKEHIEKEILEEISEDVNFCFDSMQQSYQNQGYEVNLKRGETIVELLPKRIVVDFDSELTLTKKDSEKYEDFKIVLNNNLYELVGIAQSIVEWETIYGDVDVNDYMTYYHDLKVEKVKQGDGTTIYILTDLNNDKKFQFASRSVVFAPGYKE